MEKKSKIKTIAKAYLETSKIDPQVLQQRRKICDGCEWNSKNASKDKLGLVDKTRLALSSKPFCVACDCFIDKKTESEISECGLVEKGLEPRWEAVAVETKDIKSVNLRLDPVSLFKVSLSKDFYLLSLKEIFNKNKGNIVINFEIYADTDLEIVTIAKGCGSCTETNWSRTDDKTYKATVTLLTSKIAVGTFNKSVTVKYKIDNKDYSTQIRLTGKLTR